MPDTGTLVNDEILRSPSIAIADTRELVIFKARSFNRNFDITNTSLEKVTKNLPLEGQDTRTLPLGNRIAVLESVLRPLDIFLKIRYIKTEISELREDAESLLARDELLMNVVTEAVTKIRDILNGAYPIDRYKIKIYLGKNMEVPKWEELVISIGIDEGSFDEIIKTWDKIEEKIEEIIHKAKEEESQELSHLEEIDNKLAVEVQRLGNV